MSAPGLAYVDGRIVDLAEARVPLADRGHLLGDGVFETLRAIGGTAIELEAHARRLRHGLSVLGIDPEAEARSRAAVDALVRAGTAALGDDLYVRVTVTSGVDDARGGSVTGLCLPRATRSAPVRPEGIRLTLGRERKDSRSALAGVKAVSFLPHLTARREARARGADDAILLNEHGRVAEATTSNVLAVRDGVVHAPGRAEGALDGVTRATVLALVRGLGLTVEETLDLATLDRADEVWLTNSIGGVTPVGRYEGRALALDLGREVARRLAALRPDRSA